MSGRRSMPPVDDDAAPTPSSSRSTVTLVTTSGSGGGGKGDDPSQHAASDGPTVWAIHFAELLGAMLFTYVGGGAVSVTGIVENEAVNCTRTVTVALVDGFLFYALIFLTMKLTHGQGGYYNPSITFALALTDIYLDPINYGKHLLRLATYAVAQIFGAIIGALLILASVPGIWTNGVERTGISFPNLGESLGRALVLETLLSFFLILVVLSVRSNEKRHSSFLLAFAYIACRLVVFPLTGGTLNVARSFGHAVAAGGVQAWKYIWVSFLAPMLGGFMAAATFLFLHHRELRLERSD